jgi:hypothetical protein
LVIVPSTMDSPIWGMTMSVAIIPLFRRAAQWKPRPERNQLL